MKHELTPEQEQSIKDMVDALKQYPNHYSMNPLDDIDWDEDEEQYMFDIPADEFMKGV